MSHLRLSARTAVYNRFVLRNPCASSIATPKKCCPNTVVGSFAAPVESSFGWREPTDRSWMKLESDCMAFEYTQNQSTVCEYEGLTVAVATIMRIWDSVCARVRSSFHTALCDWYPPKYLTISNAPGRKKRWHSLMTWSTRCVGATNRKGSLGSAPISPVKLFHCPDAAMCVSLIRE